MGGTDYKNPAMIPKIIHYCWFGRGEMPQSLKEYIASWHKYMPDWEYKMWNEDNFDINYNDYSREAYQAGKYAFVSDVARLYALKQEGGLYLDTDVEVVRSFDDLLHHSAFAGFEGSKALPIGTCVMASEANGRWINELLESYNGRHFLQSDGKMDLTTNVQHITRLMALGGLRQDGSEQDYKDCHIFPVEYFSPRHTTGEFIRTGNTYSDHKGLSSWNASGISWKGRLLNLLGTKSRVTLIKLKRKLLG